MWSFFITFKLSGSRERRNSTVVSASPSMLLILAATFLTIMVNLVGTFYNVKLLRQLHPPKAKEYSWAGDDYPAQLLIELPSVGLSLIEGPHFSLYADADWATVFPDPNQGFIQIGPDERWFIPAIYHQLHCLDAIRFSFVVNGTHAAEHTQHCLRYLRQAVLCHADTTLEETVIKDGPNGTIIPGAHGRGMVHRCRDWTVLRQWMEENA